MTKKQIAALVKRKSGILLDLSLGGTQQDGSVRLGPGGDIDHDPLTIPFPLPTGCVHTAVVSHVLEFLPPDQFFAWWDELHRVLRPKGIVYVSGPYGGDDAVGWLTDPTHKTRVMEMSFAWLDRSTPIYALHETIGRSQPAPWKVLSLRRAPATIGVSYEAQLQSQPR